jgi:hypothetical protein
MAQLLESSDDTVFGLSRKISATSSAGRDLAVGCYAVRWSFLFFLGFLRGCDSRSSGLSMPAIMPVATRV